VELDHIYQGAETRMIIWAGHVVRIAEMTNTNGIFVGKP
jgi:hypothetical protein